MSVKFAAAAAAFATALVAAGAAAATPALIRDYELNNSLADSLGNGTDLTTAGSLGATGITFGANQGPTMDLAAGTADYSVVTRFDFDTTGGYRKIIDFWDLGSDNGFYAYNAQLDFYPYANGGPTDFADGATVTAVYTRDSSGQINGYLNGVLAFTNDDSVNNYGVVSAAAHLRFFQDDTYTGGEASGGFVDYIKVYNGALSADDVSRLSSGAPEPAAWGLMLLGFGGIGAALRRRRATAALA